MSKVFELSPAKTIQEADWKPGSMFISHGIDSHQTTTTYLINKKPKHRYVIALTEKNARRKFHRMNLI